MALQLVGRYEHAQALLQRAHADDAGHIETALPSLLYAQLWQDFNLGRLDEAEAGAQTLIDLGQQIGTNMRPGSDHDPKRGVGAARRSDDRRPTPASGCHSDQR